MKVSYKTPATALPKTDLCVVFALEGQRPALPDGVKLTAAALRDFKGEYKETRVGDGVAGAADRVLVVGLGKKAEVDAERVRRAAAIAVKQAEALGAAKVWVVLSETVQGAAGGGEEAACAATEGLVLGAYRYEESKSQRKPAKVTGVTLTGGGADVKRGVAKGTLYAAANAYARDLQNAPGNVVTPRKLAAEAKKLAGKSARVTCTVLDEAKMKQLGMGLLLGVSAGSVEPARLVHLVYKPKGRAKAKVALVGKGLTFDAGGISIKPSAKMDEMRYDMSGGAAVLGVFHGLAAGLDVPWEVHGVVPASENLVDAAATKPGDVHTAMDGTTVEILNTDAEGRLILGDALCYVRKKVSPDTIVDLATLTGAVVVGLGHEVAGMFATTPKLRDELAAAGEAVSELVWPLPLFDSHKERMKGLYADLKNIGPGDMGAGSSQGAAFLAHFVGDVEWAHLDIAGTAWGALARDWVGGPQGTGFGARLLLRWLETRR